MLVHAVTHYLPGIALAGASTTLFVRARRQHETAVAANAAVLAGAAAVVLAREARSR